MANSNGWGDGASNNNIGWGKGADNAIGWGSIQADSWAGATDIVGTPAVDPDAQAFITAAAITDPTQQSAINTLVTNLKGYNIWTKMKALYPFVGGTSSTHKFNLKDPRNLDAAFRLVFNGGWTHSSTGATPNGTNAYADTKLNPLLTLSQNSTHISFYSRTNTDGNTSDIGLKSTGSGYTMIQAKYSNVFTAHVNEFYVFADHSSNTNGQGFYVGNRTGASVRNNWKNGSKVHTSSSPSQTQANFNFFVGALNNAGPASAYSNRQCAFASIGDGLTDAESANFYTAVQAFQTTLNRNV